MTIDKLTIEFSDKCSELKTALSNFTEEYIVTSEKTAEVMGSGDMPVLATPALVAMMENAAMLCVADELDAESSTVGGQISSSHIKPTGLGHTVTATAELIAVEGRKLKFKISASDEDGLIGEGEHLRFIIGREKFMSKVTEK